MVVPLELKNVVLVTVEPDQVLPSVLSSVDLTIALGETPRESIEAFCRAANLQAPFVSPCSP